MKTLTLNRKEAADYLRGERTFWRVMKPQPPTGDTCGGLTTCLRDIPETNFWYLAYEADRSEHFIEYRPVPQYASERWTCPHGQPGDVIGLREVWAPVPWRGTYLYRAMPMFDNMAEGDFDWKWHSASSMPLEAIRHKPTIAAIAVEQRGDLWGWMVTVKEEKDGN